MPRRKERRNPLLQDLQTLRKANRILVGAVLLMLLGFMALLVLLISTWSNASYPEQIADNSGAASSIAPHTNKNSIEFQERDVLAKRQNKLRDEQQQELTRIALDTASLQLQDTKQSLELLSNELSAWKSFEKALLTNKDGRRIASRRASVIAFQIIQEHITELRVSERLKVMETTFQQLLSLYEKAASGSIQPSPQLVSEAESIAKRAAKLAQSLEKNQKLIYALLEQGSDSGQTTLSQALADWQQQEAANLLTTASALEQQSLQQRIELRKLAEQEKRSREALKAKWRRDKKAQALLRIFTKPLKIRPDNEEQYEDLPASLQHLRTLGCLEKSNLGIKAIPYYGKHTKLEPNPYADFRPLNLGQSWKPRGYFTEAQINYVLSVQRALIEYGQFLVEEGILRE